MNILLRETSKECRYWHMEKEHRLQSGIRAAFVHPRCAPVNPGQLR